MAGTKKEKHRGVWAIGILKLLKGALLLAVAAGGLSLFNKNAATEAQRWITYFHFDANGRYFQALLRRLASISPRNISLLSAATSVYAGLFITEGIGLMMQKRWAEYFTVIVTSSFIPLEVYELVQHFNLVKVLVILLNIAIVVYLVIRLKKDVPHEARSAKNGSSRVDWRPGT